MDSSLMGKSAAYQEGFLSYQRERDKLLKDDPVGAVKNMALISAEQELRSQGADDARIEQLRNDPTDGVYLRHSAAHQKRLLGQDYDPLILSSQDRRAIMSNFDKDEAGNYLDPEAAGKLITNTALKYQNVPGAMGKVLTQLGIHPELASVLGATQGAYNDFAAGYLMANKRVASAALDGKPAGEQLAALLGLSSAAEGKTLHETIKGEIMSSPFFATLFSGKNPADLAVQNRIVFGMAMVGEERRKELLRMVDNGHNVVDTSDGFWRKQARVLFGSGMVPQRLDIGRLVLPKDGPLTVEHVEDLSSDFRVMRQVRNLAVGVPAGGFESYQDSQAQAAAKNLGILIDPSGPDKKGMYSVSVMQRAETRTGAAFAPPVPMTKDQLDNLMSEQMHKQFGLDKLRFENRGDMILLRKKDGGDILHTFTHQGLADDVREAKGRIAGEYEKSVMGALEKLGKRAAKAAWSYRADPHPEYTGEGPLVDMDKRQTEWLYDNFLSPRSVIGGIADHAVEGAKDAGRIIDTSLRSAPRAIDAVLRFGVEGVYRAGQGINAAGEYIKRKAREE